MILIRENLLFKNREGGKKGVDLQNTLRTFLYHCILPELSQRRDMVRKGAQLALPSDWIPG